MTQIQQQPGTVELFPCPFCGGGAHVIEDGGKWYAGCNDCYCLVGEGWDRDAMPAHMFISAAEAIAAWNTRSDPKLLAQRDELVAALEGLVRYAEAVRASAGMGKNQLARLEAAKAALANARQGEEG